MINLFVEVCHEKENKSILVVVFIMFLIFAFRSYFSKPDGSSIQSREELLENIPKGTDWNIAKEEELKNT